jgi:hypothetical protein
MSRRVRDWVSLPGLGLLPRWRLPHRSLDKWFIEVIYIIPMT